MGVAVHLFPVTGLTLPLISKGGTSVVFTTFAIGIILSVSARVEEGKDLNPKNMPNQPLDDLEPLEPELQ